MPIELPVENPYRTECSFCGGFMFLADVASHSPAPDPLLGEAMTSFVARQMSAEKIVAWGCPEVTLNIEFTYANNFDPFDRPQNYAAGFSSRLRTSGLLCFNDHPELWDES